MKLSDVVSHAGLAIYAEVALVIFALAFVAVLFQITRKRHGFDAAAALPLADDVARPNAEQRS